MEDFQKHVRDYKDQVFNTCLGLVKNFQDAEDLAQEVFIEMYQKGSGFRGDSSLKTWVYQIAINKSLQFLRWKKAKKRSGESVDIHDQISLESDVFEHPGVQMENKELASVLFKAIEKLPESQQVAFTLHKIENLKHEEIGVILNKSRSSIESLIHRARQNLKEHLKFYYENHR